MFTLFFLKLISASYTVISKQLWGSVIARCLKLSVLPLILIDFQIYYFILIFQKGYKIPEFSVSVTQKKFSVLGLTRQDSFFAELSA